MDEIQEDSPLSKIVELDENQESVMNDQKKYKIKQNQTIYYLSIKIINNNIKFECFDKSRNFYEFTVTDLNYFQNISEVFTRHKSISETFKILSNIFDTKKNTKNKITIEIKKNKIILKLMNYLHYEERYEKIEVSLAYKKKNCNELLKKYESLENEIQDLKITLKNQTDKLNVINSKNDIIENKKKIFLKSYEKAKKSNEILERKFKKLENDFDKLIEFLHNKLNENNDNKIKIEYIDEDKNKFQDGIEENNLNRNDKNDIIDQNEKQMIRPIFKPQNLNEVNKNENNIKNINLLLNQPNLTNNNINNIEEANKNFKNIKDNINFINSNNNIYNNNMVNINSNTNSNDINNNSNTEINLLK